MSQTPQNSYYRQTALFALINLPFSAVIFLPFFVKSMQDNNAPVAINALMFFSTIIFLSLMYFCLLLAVSLLKPPRTLMLVVAALAAAVFHIFFIVDYRIFSLFKFHINGLVLNFLTTEGSSDSLSLSRATFLTLALTFGVVLCVEVLLARRAYRPAAGEAGGPRRSLVAALIAVLFCVVLADKAVYAYADLTNRASVLQNTRYYPYYLTLKMRTYTARLFGYTQEKLDEVASTEPGNSLHYPLRPLEFDARAPRYNILYLVPDGLRSDMVTPEIMPNLYRFSKKHLVFKDHYSGGNATRFGIFSLFYGLDGNLWPHFLAARRGPVLIDSLQKLNYQFAVFSSTRLTFPEFRETVFVNIPGSITDEFSVDDKAGRDRLLADGFSRFLKARDRSRPFMGFLFFDSCHYYFQYPPEFKKFLPVVDEEINYSRDISPELIAAHKNRYKNALFFIDSLIARVVRDLERAGAFENTILVITGDHGTEFKENGYFFHNSAFDDYEVKTSLVMSVPGKKPGVVVDMTSHLDITPTLLSLLGCTTPAESYSHGRDMFSPGKRSTCVSAAWGECALVSDRYRIIFPTASGWGKQRVEVRNGGDYKLVDDKDVLKRYRPELLDTMKGFGRFLK